MCGITGFWGGAPAHALTLRAELERIQAHYGLDYVVAQYAELYHKLRERSIG